MTDTIWIFGVGFAATAASYIHVYLGLAVISAAIFTALLIWGLSGGNPLIWLALGAPAVFGLCFGRWMRRRQENV